MKPLVKKLLIISCLFGFIGNSKGQGSWTQKASLAALNGRFSATGFSIGHYGYIGTGQTPSGFTNDFWRWNQNNNTWTAIANYAGLGRYGMTSFTINGKGYTCLGWSGASNEKDMWEYDSATNTWTQKASFPGNARYAAFVFVIGTNAYVGCGEPNGTPYYQDMWEYNSITDTWRQRANFAGGNRAGMIAFSFGKYGYAGCGGNGATDFNDLWRYDSAANTWTSVASLPIPSNQLGSAVTFVISGKAYVGTGQKTFGGPETRNFWSYDSATGIWTPVTTLTGVSRWGSVGFTVGNKGYVGMGLDSANNKLTDYWEFSDASQPATCNTWTQRLSLGALNGRFSATGFSIGHYGYIGTGQTPSGFTNDFWRWNQNNNTWTAIANYAGLGRYGMTSFTINGKGYTCLGWSGASNEKDMWEYDSATNTWTQKASFPGNARYAAFVFVIGTNAYVGCGEPNGTPYYQDMWEYNSITDTWRQRANFAGGNRAGMIAFSFGKYGYAGCGGNGATDFNDLWRYDSAANTWTSVASLPIPSNQLGSAVTFVISGKAYVGTGQKTFGGPETRNFWSYDSATGIWTPVTTLTGVSRWGSVGFTIGNKGYVGMGLDSANNKLTDYWEYYPCDTIPLSINNTSSNSIIVNLYPNPNKGRFTIQLANSEKLIANSHIEIYNTLGEKVYNKPLNPSANGQGDSRIDLSNEASGVYLYRVVTETGDFISDGKFIIQK